MKPYLVTSNGEKLIKHCEIGSLWSNGVFQERSNFKFDLETSDLEFEVCYFMHMLRYTK